MNLNLRMLFLICALIVFVIDAFKSSIAPDSRVSWTPLGFAFVVASLLVG